MRRLLIAILLIASLAGPVYADDGDTRGAGADLFEFIKSIFLNSDLNSVLADVDINTCVSGNQGFTVMTECLAAQANPDMYTDTWTLFGWDNFDATAYGPGTSRAAIPADYIPDSPQALREAGYGLEQLDSDNLQSMAIMDVAHWLGYAVAVPFVYVKAFKTLAGMSGGPLNLVVNVVMLWAVWITFVHFIIFLIHMAGAVKSLSETVMQFGGLLKP